MTSSSSLNELSQLYRNQRVKAMFTEKGYDVLNIQWEDTGRYQNSCWGSNISDQSLVVDNTLMPVVRRPNFTDKTFDVDIKEFNVFSGNDTGDGKLVKVPLKTFLEGKGWFLPRDEKLLVSTQACFLPLQDGFCKFGVKIHNYQTSSDDPTLACIVASAQGVSCAPITEYNQTLYFNRNGRAHPFEARRLEEDRKERKVQDAKALELTSEEKQRNMLLIFHVPLKKQKVPPRGEYHGFINTAAYDDDGDDVELGFQSASLDSDGVGALLSASSKPVFRGFDAAVLRVADEDRGAFPTFNANQKYVRDPDLPIRCTVQYYVGVDSATGIDIKAVNYVSDCLGRVSFLPGCSAQGSLVVDDPATIAARVTAPTGGAKSTTIPFADTDQVMVNL